MKTALVGYSGFVGGNLANSCDFTNKYNSKNISDAFGTAPDLLIYSGVPAAKFLANKNPDKDYEICMNALLNINKIKPKQLVLISTVDVFEESKNADENTATSVKGAQAYGRNRAILETCVQQEYENALIIRLPGLFGKGLKKNFIYDALTLVPSMLKQEKYTQLAQKSELVKNAYTKQENGFYALTQKAKTTDKAALKTYFNTSDFNALNFTDSRAYYQFYNLANLYNDIITALNANLKLLNLATQPVGALQIYEKISGAKFINEISQKPIYYDMQTNYAHIYGKHGRYIYTKDEILSDILNFAENFNK